MRPGSPIGCAGRPVPNAHLVAWQFTDLAALGTDPARAQREVLWVTPDGEIAGGAQAFARWLQFRGGAYGLLGRCCGCPAYGP